VSASDVIILRLNVWHSYYPDKNTGWHEHWIGFKGNNIDSRFEKLGKQQFTVY